MAAGLQVGETVFVPVSILDADVSSPSAFYRTRVQHVANKSVEVDVPGGTEWVASSKCQRNIGVCIIAVGDFRSEATLIDPLSKSILQFTRLLCSDDYVKYLKVRSKSEVSQFWAFEHAAFSHIIFIGHGNGSQMQFAVEGWVNGADLAAELDLPRPAPKTFLNLSCQLGKASYAKHFSLASSCEAFIAPFQSVHGAVASHFAQSFLIYHLLHGESLAVAYRHARDYVAGAVSFRCWKNGSMT